MAGHVAFTVSEWRRVQNLFNSDRLSDLKECHVLLSLWSNRSGKERIALTCSELLIGILIATRREWPEDCAYMAYDERRRQYSIAVIRFINYINELGQKGNSLISIKAAVREFGVPGWLVDLRHEASHDRLPNLTDLEEGMKFARKWLWDNFWNRPMHEAVQRMGGVNRKQQQAVLDHQDKMSKISEAFISYISWRAKNPHFKMATTEVDQRPPIVKTIADFIINEPFDTLRIVSQEGFLIMNDSQLKYFPGFNAMEDPIPPYVQLFWEPLMHLCYEQKIINYLVLSMMEKLRDESGDEALNGQRAQWISMFITVAAHGDACPLSEDDWSRVLSTVIAHPTLFTQETIEVVMEKTPDLSSIRKAQVQKLLDITLDDSQILEDESFAVRTIDDLRAAMQRDKQKTVENTGGWTQCTEEEWPMGLPLGLAPGQKVDEFSLIIEEAHIQLWEGVVVPTIPLNIEIDRTPTAPVGKGTGKGGNSARVPKMDIVPTPSGRKRRKISRNNKSQ